MRMLGQKSGTGEGEGKGSVLIRLSGYDVYEGLA